VIPVVEIFGPTLQGEGPAAGRGASFLRLGGCNLSCAWCDTPESWDGARFDLRKEMTPLTVRDMLTRLVPAEIVVVTGGEPLLHQRNPEWSPLMAALAEEYGQVHFETNGTIAPTVETCTAASLFVVSPKMRHAGPHRGKQDPAMDPSWPLLEQAVAKIVVQTARDVQVAVDTAIEQGWSRDRIWVMPEGRTRAELDTRWPRIATAAASLGVNASHRLHLLAWSGERGH